MIPGCFGLWSPCHHSFYRYGLGQNWSCRVLVMVVGVMWLIFVMINVNLDVQWSQVIFAVMDFKIQVIKVVQARRLVTIYTIWTFSHRDLLDLDASHSKLGVPILHFQNQALARHIGLGLGLLVDVPIFTSRGWPPIRCRSLGLGFLVNKPISSTRDRALVRWVVQGKVLDLYLT